MANKYIGEEYYSLPRINPDGLDVVHRIKPRWRMAAPCYV